MTSMRIFPIKRVGAGIAIESTTGGRTEVYETGCITDILHYTCLSIIS